ncbi:MAG: sulfotransferase [Rhodanobacteraceae bacterium]
MQQLIINAVRALEERRYDEARACARSLVDALPGDEGALSLLALSEQNLGNLVEARHLLEALTGSHPGTWQHWNNLGNVLRQLDDPTGAARAFLRALELNDASARLHANLGLLLLNQADFSGARARLCRAVTMDGAEPGMAIWAAVACRACADDANARNLIRDWRQWPRQSDEATLELGWLLVELGRVDEGISVLQGNFADENIRLRARARHAFALERINRIAEAADVVNGLPPAESISDPQTRMETLNARATIAMRRDDFAAARRDYERALAIDLPFRQSLQFGLARACDKLDDTDAAMAALADAHHADQSTQATDEERPGAIAHNGLLSLVTRHPAPDDNRSWNAIESPDAADSPVFVVGFPRSGTTLVEQILAAHETLVSVDEQPFVQRLIGSIRERGLDYPADLGKLAAVDRNALRSLYWAEARKLANLRDGQRLIDKHPLNFLALPLVRRIFANAPMVFCVRHPCDVILSCYMQQFRDPQLAAVCVSIDRLAHEYARLMDHWLHDYASFPDHVQVCRYETLVTDFDAETKKFGAFLGIDDVAGMRSFAEHALARGFITTPSYAQVVQPLSADAIGRWRRYRNAFEPVLPLLAPVMRHWGYEV